MKIDGAENHDCPDCKTSGIEGTIMLKHRRVYPDRVMEGLTQVPWELRGPYCPVHADVNKRAFEHDGHEVQLESWRPPQHIEKL